jgi:TATA-box binding protein (TBP) (component of TFIID and TFIIIB)
MKWSVTFLIFGSGKVVCVGAKSTKDIKESFDRLVKKLRKFKAQK